MTATGNRTLGRLPCSSSPSPSKAVSLSSSFLLSSVPRTLCVQVPDGRPYTTILRQTEDVYNQLLSDRQRKLQQKINETQKQDHDKYWQLYPTDRNKAAEFERWAVPALVQLRDESIKELHDLRQDYESKFHKLRVSLEEQPMAGHKTNHIASNCHHPSSLGIHQPMQLANRR